MLMFPNPNTHIKITAFVDFSKLMKTSIYIWNLNQIHNKPNLSSPELSEEQHSQSLLLHWYVVYANIQLVLLSPHLQNIKQRGCNFDMRNKSHVKISYHLSI